MNRGIAVLWLLVILALGCLMAFVALVNEARAHDTYIGMRDPVTGGSCCSTARGDGYGDCSVLDLAPGVLTPVPEGYIVKLSKDQAVKINPRAIRGVEVFVPRERIQSAKFNEYRLCMGPTGTLYCFFEPGGA